MHSMDWKDENTFRYEFILRLLFIASVFIIVNLNWLGVYIGDEINYPLVYGLTSGYLLLNLLWILGREKFSYQGDYWYIVVAIDFTITFAYIFATGGAESNLFLMLGIVPMIAGVYFGLKGAVVAGVAEIAAFTFVVLLDKVLIKQVEATNYSHLVIRYVYIAGSALFDAVITGLMAKDRDRLEVLYKISQSNSSIPILSRLVESILGLLSDHLRASKVLLILYEEQSDDLRIQEPAIGLSAVEIATINDQLNSEEAYEKLLSVDKSMRTNANFLPGLAGEQASSKKSRLDVMITSLRARERKIGYIVLWRREDQKEFTRRDERFMNLVSDHIAVYIENTLLYKKSEENVAQLSSLIRVVDAIGSLSKLDDIYTLALDVVRGLFAPDMALINVVNRKTGLLEPVKSFGFSEYYQLHNLGRPFERILDCFVLTHDRGFLSPDIDKDKRCPNLRVEEGVKSVLCTAIKSGKEVYGILHLASRYPGAFNEQDLTLANAIGEQLGIALERAELFNEINRLAITDSLTGLYNRRYLNNILEDEIKRSSRYNHPLSFVMIDIDHFKFYNDRNGHPMGDQVLRDLAKILKENTREVDVLFRYGGEEFLILVPEANKDEAVVMAERIRSMVKEFRFPMEEDQPEGDLTISIGVASYPEDGASGELLIEMADRALYQAKRMGRDSVIPYSVRYPDEHNIRGSAKWGSDGKHGQYS